MKTIYSTSLLQASTSTGKRKFWQGHVSTDGRDYFTYTTYCQTIGKEIADVKSANDLQAFEGSSISKITQSAYVTIQGKNIGRSNETTPEQQAIQEINSTFKTNKDKGYYEIGETNDKSFVLPMLAYPLGDKIHTIEFPLTVQPKFDGIRCLTDGENMWSRRGKQFDNKIVAHLNSVACNDFIVDGELILPEGYPLQDTVSAAKKFRDNLSPKLLYRIYDIVAPDLCYTERYEICKKIVEDTNNPQVILAPSHVVETQEEIYPLHEKFVGEGWEGTMIRLHGHGYKINQRTNQLLKLKDFLEEEFKVVDVIDGKGKFVGAGIFLCETPEGKIFETSPIGTMEYRRELFQNRDSIIGTYWTVRFQAYTKDKIPQFGRAINQREEDIQG
jgi:DNA ligase 1